MQQNKQLSNPVQELVKKLCDEAGVQLNKKSLHGHTLENKPLSIRISSETSESTDRSIGQKISTIMWKDEDNFPILAALYNDTKGLLFELEIWKMNFSIPSDITGWKNQNLQRN